MKMFFEKEFYEIQNDFKNELRVKQKLISKEDLNFAILGSPLMHSNILILSINWGGGLNKESNVEMPTTNELIEFPTEINNAKLIKFFSYMFDSKERVMDFLQNSIYTNACFIRTPNTKNNYNIVKLGYEISLPYLKKLIELIKIL